MNIYGPRVVGVATIDADTYRAAGHTCLKALAILLQAHTFTTFTTCFVCYVCATLLKLRVKRIRIPLEDRAYGMGSKFRVLLRVAARNSLTGR